MKKDIYTYSHSVDYDCRIHCYGNREIEKKKG